MRHTIGSADDWSLVYLRAVAGWQFNQTRLPVEPRQFDANGDFNPSSCALSDVDGDGSGTATA